MDVKFDPRVLQNEAHNQLRLCPGDDEPRDFEEEYVQLIQAYKNEIKMIEQKKKEIKILEV